jgi:hypothetical protein
MDFFNLMWIYVLQLNVTILTLKNKSFPLSREEDYKYRTQKFVNFIIEPETLFIFC